MGTVLMITVNNKINKNGMTILYPTLNGMGLYIEQINIVKKIFDYIHVCYPITLNHSMDLDER